MILLDFVKIKHIDFNENISLKEKALFDFVRSMIKKRSNGMEKKRN